MRGLGDEEKMPRLLQRAEGRVNWGGMGGRGGGHVKSKCVWIYRVSRLPVQHTLLELAL